MAPEPGRFAPVLDEALQSRQYLLGDSITLADYSMIHLEGFKNAAAASSARTMCRFTT